MFSELYGQNARRSGLEGARQLASRPHQEPAALPTVRAPRSIRRRHRWTRCFRRQGDPPPADGRRTGHFPDSRDPPPVRDTHAGRRKEVERRPRLARRTAQDRSCFCASKIRSFLVGVLPGLRRLLRRGRTASHCHGPLVMCQTLLERAARDPGRMP